MSRVRVTQMVRASHRKSEGYRFDSHQGPTCFSEIRLDTHAHSKIIIYVGIYTYIPTNNNEIISNNNDNIS